MGRSPLFSPREEGRCEVHVAWEAWNKRRKEAEAQRIQLIESEFDEPAPFGTIGDIVVPESVL